MGDYKAVLTDEEHGESQCGKTEEEILVVEILWCCSFKIFAI